MTAKHREFSHCEGFVNLAHTDGLAFITLTNGKAVINTKTGCMGNKWNLTLK
jgi:hypothetical protein